ncbi:MAG: sugar ABC transporter permease [Synechococcus sp. XM-24]|nr:MAG: sugar ABC transporter permease [Synechococcus sp. XM-24]
MRTTFAGAIFSHRDLIKRLAQREILMRYRGSVAGWGWTLINPLMMLAIYTFVFSTIFKARWESSADLGSAGFALNIFAGMIAFSTFAECINRAPSLITSNANYVTKVRFPLETLGCSVLINAIFHATTSLGVLLAFKLIATGALSWVVILLPIAWTPYILSTLAFVWLLSAAGVYLRDLNQFVVVATSALTFLSAIFYPISALPENLIPIFRLNPVADWVESTRSLLIMDQIPNFNTLVVKAALAAIFCEGSYRLFRKASRGFADVV